MSPPRAFERSLPQAGFPEAARLALADTQLRRNMGYATQTIRTKRALVVDELPEADECCGFGGTFAVKNADTSAAMLADKVRSVLDTRAEVCAAADSSCLMHIGGVLRRQRAGTRVMHLAEILAARE